MDDAFPNLDDISDEQALVERLESLFESTSAFPGVNNGLQIDFNLQIVRLFGNRVLDAVWT